MRRFGSIALFIALAKVLASAQQPAQMQPEPDRVKVYSAGPGVTAPTLLPMDLPPIPAGECGERINGKVKLSILVDTGGRARNIMFLHPLGTDADRFAIQIAKKDQFKPGAFDGKPVVVAQSLEIEIQACRRKTIDAAGKLSSSLQLTSVPVQKLESLTKPPNEAVFSEDQVPGSANIVIYARTDIVSGLVSEPVLLFQPAMTFTDVRGLLGKIKKGEYCEFSLVVDAHGIPEGVKQTKSVGNEMDQFLLTAILQYRYKPALKNGQPVPLRTNLEYHF